MGADGGTIPKRCELVKKKKKTEKIEKSVKNATKWRTCQVSQQPLKKPIIADRLGNLFNKEAVIEALLNKTLPPNAAHIKGMKDFKELRLTENKDFKDGDSKGGDAYNDVNQTPFLCPVTSVPMNGINSFIFNWKCGCVISEKAVSEIKGEKACHGCGLEWKNEDVVVLYPEEELLEKYKEALDRKKLKKKEKETASASVAGPSSSKLPPPMSNGGDVAVKKEIKKENGTSVENLLKRKATSIQDDKTKTDAYKKLFTTCEAAKNKPANHWVTYNPLFY